jgi:hypothetical protein
MRLEKRVENAILSNRSFVLASMAYLSGSLVDTLSIIYGLYRNQIQEINPIALEWLYPTGDPGSLLIHKSILTVSILSIAKYIDCKHKESKTQLKAEYFLYPAAALTALMGLSWMVDKYFIFGKM